LLHFQLSTSRWRWCQRKSTRRRSRILLTLLLAAAALEAPEAEFAYSDDAHQPIPETDFVEEFAEEAQQAIDDILLEEEPDAPDKADATEDFRVETGGFHTVKHDKNHRKLGTKVVAAVKQHFNDAEMACFTEAPSTKSWTAFKIKSMATQEVEGTEISAVIEAERNDGMIKEFTVHMRRQLQSHPKVVPSSQVKGVGKHDAMRKMSIHSVDPPPASCWKAAPTNDFAELSDSEFVQQKLGYVPEPKGSIYTDQTELTEEQEASIPSSWDWRKKAPNCDAFSPLNQGGCGSCWAFAASQAMSARFCIQSNGTANPRISPQWTVSCGKKDGCNGGASSTAWKAMQVDGKLGGAVDRKCNPYLSKDATHANAKCNKVKGGKPVSSSCFRYFVDESPLAKKYNWKWNRFATHYGGQGKSTTDPKSIAKIQHELMTNGPMFAAFTVYQDFNGYKGGVYTHKSGKRRGGHATMLIGWGVEDKVPYWLIQTRGGRVGATMVFSRSAGASTSAVSMVA
jgi:cathepsin B